MTVKIHDETIVPSIAMDRLRMGGGVKRYHTRPLIGEQTVAAHSWGVACICMRLSGGQENRDVLYLYEAALLHDVAEYDTGDIPATAKWESPTLKAALEDLERAVESRIGISTDKLEPWSLWALKFADMLELLWFCVEQRRLGNVALDHVWENGHSFMEKHIKNPIAERVHGWSAMYREVLHARDAIFPNEPSST